MEEEGGGIAGRNNPPPLIKQFQFFFQEGCPKISPKTMRIFNIQAERRMEILSYAPEILEKLEFSKELSRNKLAKIFTELPILTGCRANDAWLLAEVYPLKKEQEGHDAEEEEDGVGYAEEGQIERGDSGANGVASEIEGGGQSDTKHVLNATHSPTGGREKGKLFTARDTKHSGNDTKHSPMTSRDNDDEDDDGMCRSQSSPLSSNSLSPSRRGGEVMIDWKAFVKELRTLMLYYMEIHKTIEMIRDSSEKTMDALLPNGNTLVIAAVEYGNIRLLEEIIREKKISGNLLNRPNYYGQTPLMLAAKMGFASAVGLLLYHHANVNSVDEDGWAPLHYAASNGHLHVIVGICHPNSWARFPSWTDEDLGSFRGAAHDDEILKQLITAETTSGYTPLMLAVEGGHIDCVRFLHEEANADFGKSVTYLPSDVDEERRKMRDVQRHLSQQAIGADNQENSELLIGEEDLNFSDTEEGHILGVMGSRKSEEKGLLSEALDSFDAAGKLLGIASPRTPLSLPTESDMASDKAKSMLPAFEQRKRKMRAFRRAYDVVHKAKREFGPMAVAAFSGHIEIVKYLSSHGASLEEYHIYACSCRAPIEPLRFWDIVEDNLFWGSPPSRRNFEFLRETGITRVVYLGEDDLPKNVKNLFNERAHLQNEYIPINLPNGINGVIKGDYQPRDVITSSWLKSLIRLILSSGSDVLYLTDSVGCIISGLALVCLEKLFDRTQASRNRHTSKRANNSRLPQSSSSKQLFKLNDYFNKVVGRKLTDFEDKFCAKLAGQIQPQRIESTQPDLIPPWWTMQNTDFQCVSRQSSSMLVASPGERRSRSTLFKRSRSPSRDRSKSSRNTRSGKKAVAPDAIDEDDTENAKIPEGKSPEKKQERGGRSQPASPHSKRQLRRKRRNFERRLLRRRVLEGKLRTHHHDNDFLFERFYEDVLSEHFQLHPEKPKNLVQGGSVKEAAIGAGNPLAVKSRIVLRNGIISLDGKGGEGAGGGGGGGGGEGEGGGKEEEAKQDNNEQPENEEIEEKIPLKKDAVPMENSRVQSQAGPCGCCSGGDVESTASSAQGEWVVRAKGGVHIRKRPSLRASRVGVLKYQEEVLGLELDRKWLRHQRGWSLIAKPKDGAALLSRKQDKAEAVVEKEAKKGTPPIQPVTEKQVETKKKMKNTKKKKKTAKRRPLARTTQHVCSATNGMAPSVLVHDELLSNDFLDDFGSLGQIFKGLKRKEETMAFCQKRFDIEREEALRTRIRKVIAAFLEGNRAFSMRETDKLLERSYKRNPSECRFCPPSSRSIDFAAHPTKPLSLQSQKLAKINRWWNGILMRKRKWRMGDRRESWISRVAEHINREIDSAVDINRILFLSKWRRRLRAYKTEWLEIKDDKGTASNGFIGQNLQKEEICTELYLNRLTMENKRSLAVRYFRLFLDEFQQARASQFSLKKKDDAEIAKLFEKPWRLLWEAMERNPRSCKAFEISRSRNQLSKELSGALKSQDVDDGKEDEEEEEKKKTVSSFLYSMISSLSYVDGGQGRFEKKEKEYWKVQDRKQLSRWKEALERIFKRLVFGFKEEDTDLIMFFARALFHFDEGALAQLAESDEWNEVIPSRPVQKVVRFLRAFRARMEERRTI